MAKIFHILGIVACAGMFFTFIYFMEEHQDAYRYDWDYDYYDDYSYGETSYDEFDSFEDTWSIRRDIGFQGGANYQLYPQIALEGLIKISNMNLRNEIGETTDVSLAGLEVRGRYSF